MKHFVYLITNTINDKIYVGVHSSNNLKFDSYYGSSKQLKVDIKKFGKQKFTRQILHECLTKQEALLIEAQIVNREFVERNDTYNLIIGGAGFNNQGFAVAKDMQGNILYVSTDDPRWKTRQIVGINSGRVPVYDCFGNTFSVSITDERLKTGEISCTTTGRITVKDKEGNTLSISNNDPRWLSGELIAVNTGKHWKNAPGFIVGEANPIYGKKCITNGVKNRFINQQDSIPKGWKVGGAKMPSGHSSKEKNPCYGKRRITNGINMRYINLEQDIIPQGWRVGTPNDFQRGQKHYCYNKIWITDGSKNRMILKNTEIPSGWVKGITRR